MRAVDSTLQMTGTLGQQLEAGRSFGMFSENFLLQERELFSVKTKTGVHTVKISHIWAISQAKYKSGINETNSHRDQELVSGLIGAKKREVCTASTVSIRPVSILGSFKNRVAPTCNL